MLERANRRYPDHDKIKLPALNVSGTCDGALTTVQSLQELVDEAHEMKHCVDSYWPEVINGRSVILRYKNEEKRLTLEVRNGEVAQCVGEGNARQKLSAKIEEVVSRFVRSDVGKEALQKYRDELKRCMKEVDVDSNTGVMPF